MPMTSLLNIAKRNVKKLDDLRIYSSSDDDDCDDDVAAAQKPTEVVSGLDDLMTPGVEDHSIHSSTRCNDDLEDDDDDDTDDTDDYVGDDDDYDYALRPSRVVVTHLHAAEPSRVVVADLHAPGPSRVVVTDESDSDCDNDDEEAKRLRVRFKDGVKKSITKYEPVPIPTVNRDADGNFKCEQCEKLFKYKSHCLRHLSKHNTDRLHKCPVCRKEYKRLDTLNRHQRKHYSKKMYRCNMCENKYRDRASASAHFKEKHEREDPVRTCSVCDKEFLTDKSLRYHLYSHGNVKNFKCEQCPAEFSNPWGKSRHKKNKHTKQ